MKDVLRDEIPNFSAEVEQKAMSDGKRGTIRTQLYKFLENNGKRTPVYRVEVEHYLSLFDKWRNLEEMSDKFFGKPDYEKLYISISSEMRQVEKSMQGILDFLGFNDPPPREEPEEEDVDL